MRGGLFATQVGATAGRKATISVRVYRAATDTWEDLGVVAQSEPPRPRSLWRRAIDWLRGGAK